MVKYTFPLLAAKGVFQPLLVAEGVPAFGWPKVHFHLWRIKDGFFWEGTIVSISSNKGHNVYFLTVPKEIYAVVTEMQ